MNPLAMEMELYYYMLEDHHVFEDRHSPPSPTATTILSTSVIPVIPDNLSSILVVEAMTDRPGSLFPRSRTMKNHIFQYIDSPLFSLVARCDGIGFVVVWNCVFLVEREVASRSLCLWRVGAVAFVAAVFVVGDGVAVVAVLVVDNEVEVEAETERTVWIHISFRLVAFPHSPFLVDRIYHIHHTLHCPHCVYYLYYLCSCYMLCLLLLCSLTLYNLLLL